MNTACRFLLCNLRVVNYGPPSAAVTEIARFLAEPANHKYQDVSGVLPLREGITQKLAAENCIEVGEVYGNRLMVTAGGNQAFLNVALGILDPGDEVILPVPYYFNHEMAITMVNARPVLVPTDSNYQLDLGALRAAITPRPRAIVTVSPNNPSGAVYPETTLRAVNALCAERGFYHINPSISKFFFCIDGVGHE